MIFLSLKPWNLGSRLVSETAFTEDLPSPVNRHASDSLQEGKP